MYDTLYLWIPVDLISDPIIIPQLRLSLTNARETISVSQKTIESSGSHDNLFIRIRDTGVFICGSLCKYYFGNNQETLTLTTAHQALKKLADTTGLPIFKASVYRIDIAENYIMQQPAWDYVDSLGSTTYYNRLEQDNGVYYRNKRRQLLFYDKVAEQKKEKQPLLDIFEGQNVLRYEIQFKKKIPEQTGVSEVTVSHLVDPFYYKQLLHRYLAEYQSINKVQKVLLELKNIKDGKDFLTQLLRAGAAHYGGEEALLRQIDELRDKPYFDCAVNRSRLKKKIKGTFNRDLSMDFGDPIGELGEKIALKVSSEIVLLGLDNMEVPGLDLNEPVI